MLSEFALDPSLLNNWNTFHYLVEHFGIPHGRMISEFPKIWKRMVRDACRECQPVERLRIVEALNRIDPKLLPALRTYDTTRSWVENAELQHRAAPFHAIITGHNLANAAYVLSPDELNETHPLWAVQREAPIARKAEDMAACVEKLLLISSEILFIDPNFNPQHFRFRKPLELFIEGALRGKPVARIEYHAKDDDHTMSSEAFKAACERHLPRIIPIGVELSLYRWKQRVGGDALHARYVLTELGGLRFEYGLDEGDSGETLDISLLDTGLYKIRWDSFQCATAVYDLVDEVHIFGQKR